MSVAWEVLAAAVVCVRVSVSVQSSDRQGLDRGRTVLVDCDYWFACAPPPLPSPVTETIRWGPVTATAVQHLHISWSKWQKQCRSEAL